MYLVILIRIRKNVKRVSRKNSGVRIGFRIRNPPQADGGFGAAGAESKKPRAAGARRISAPQAPLE